MGRKIRGFRGSPVAEATQICFVFWFYIRFCEPLSITVRLSPFPGVCQDFSCDFIPKTEAGHQIEKSCRQPIVVGRVTPCAPRLPPECANHPQRLFLNPLPISVFSMFLRPNFGVQVYCRVAPSFSCLQEKGAEGNTAKPKCLTIKYGVFGLWSSHNPLRICTLLPILASNF